MERVYFPQTNYKLTQGYGNWTSNHWGRYALDIAGAKAIYAPFTGTIKKLLQPKNTELHANTCWLVSDEKVLFADGTVDYAVFQATHPAEISNFKKGQKFKQDEFMFNVGATGNATGNHLDFEIAKGRRANYYKNSKGKYQLYNSEAPENLMFMKDSCTVEKETYRKGLISKTFHFKKESEMLKTVKAPSPLRIHKTPDFDESSTIARVFPNTTVTYFGIKNKLAFVQTKAGVLGYCSPKYLK